MIRARFSPSPLLHPGQHLLVHDVIVTGQIGCAVVAVVGPFGLHLEHSAFDDGPRGTSLAEVLATEVVHRFVVLHLRPVGDVREALKDDDLGRRLLALNNPIIGPRH